jgi:hypothetical protein
MIASSAIPRRPWRGLAAVLALAALLATAPAGVVRAGPHPAEQRKIEAQALESFRRVLALWREEVYFELYDHGTEASKARISREDFAQRMVQLEWLPFGEPNPRLFTADFRFRTMVYIKTQIAYRNKFDASQQFTRDQNFLLQLEQGEWRVDLIDILRSPYAT